LKWIIEQVWSDVVFLHWKIPAELLQEQIPFPLDLFEGSAILSIVPFRMHGIRFPFSFSLPFVSSLWELNLRTYVRVNGERGIYFLTLDTDSRIGQWIAEKFFHLPYRLAKITAHATGNSYQIESSCLNAKFRLVAKTKPQLKEKTALDHWSTERYSLFLLHAGEAYRGRVTHSPWPLSEVKVLELHNQFSNAFGFELAGEPVETSHCTTLKVRFAPFEKLLNPATNLK
jgi:uncharacterized protein YqjF (DUF2071 family)